MLTVERRIGTSLRIGDDIRVKVRWIKSRKAVRLGIEAPPDVPIVREDAVDTEPNHLQEPEGQDFRVVLVEDDPGHAELILVALERQGIRSVEVAVNGQEALEIMGDGRSMDSDQRPHLVLLDLNLPDISGLDVLSRLRESGHKSLPVVMLSCADEDEHVTRCLDAGANAFVRKSTEYAELRTSISRITDFWRHVRHTA